MPAVAFSEGEEAEYARFRKAAEEYRVTAGGGRSAVQLEPDSLLQWTNPVRSQERGAVFIWTDEGRPAVIGSLFTYQHDGRVWDKAEFQSLADTPLQMTRDGKTVWTPQPVLEWLTPDRIPAPAASPRQRLVQMRQIARGYRVRLFDPKEDATELRVLTQPLFRYSAPAAGVVDGAIFSYAVATDPEALLIVEAAGDAASPEWRCAFARFHYWKLQAEGSGGEIVWTVDLDLSQETHVIGDESQFRKSYSSFRPTTEPVRNIEP